MSYDIDAIEKVCAEHKMRFDRISPHEVEITLEPDCVLFLANLIEEDDTMIGFKNTPWHTHDELIVMDSENTSIELGEVEVVRSLATGVLLVVSRWVDGTLTDRWLAHRDEKFDLKYIEPLEELRIKQIA